MGLRPVVDLLFAPFLTLSMDALVNSAGKLRYLSGGQFELPACVLTMTGAGWGVGGQHNHNLEAMFVHAPGVKVVMPSTAGRLRRLFKAAIRDDNPVLFFMDLALAHTPGDVPAGEHLVPLGRADVVREGIDLTIVSYAKTVGHCLQAADTLSHHGIDAEVIDLRTLKPLDTATLLRSVRKTGRAMVVHEASGLCGVAAEVSAFLAEHAFRCAEGARRARRRPGRAGGRELGARAGGGAAGGGDRGAGDDACRRDGVDRLAGDRRGRRR